MFDLDSEVKGKIPTSCGNQAGLQEIAVRRRARGRLGKQSLQFPRPCFPVGAVFCILAGDFVKKLALAVPAAILRPRSIVFAVILVAPVAGIFRASAAEPVRGAPAIDHCQQVKSVPARQACVDSLKAAAGGNNLLAATLMRRAVAAAPKEGVVRMLLGLILLQGDYAPTVERELRQARKDGAPDSVLLPPLLRTMIARHEEDQLLAEFPEPAPDATGEVTAYILHGRALALRSLGRVDEAVTAMDRSLLLLRSPLALRDSAEMAVLQRNPALAGKLIDEALHLDPKDASILLLKLQLLERSGDTAKMLAFSDQMLKMYPSNMDARVIRINVFLKLRQDGRAKGEVDAILARSPMESVGRYYQAVLLDRANNKGAAWQIMLALPPEFVKTHPQYALQMARLALDNGHVDTATGFLGSALGAAPDMLDVRVRLAELKMDQYSSQSAMVLLTPVQDSRDPRVQKLLAKVRAAIAKNRAF
jgi:tetratricopeptide (TPR) repeat protein